MKLLFTLTAYPPSTGGAQLHTHFLAQQMLGRHDVKVVRQWDDNRTDWLLGTTLRAPGRTHDYVIDGIHVHRIGLSLAEKIRLIPFVLSYYPFMDRALSSIASCIVDKIQPYATQADLIHNVRIGREGLSYASMQVARQSGIPFVFTPVHHPRWVGWRYRSYIELYRRADMLIALTNAEKRALVALGVREERIAVTGIGPILAQQANPEIFLSKHHIDGPMVLFLGQHYKYKGFRQVLEAADLVWQRVPETHFVFIGPPVGRSERFFRRADRRVHRLGKVDLQTKTDALAASSLLCVPSTQESFGGVYTEAWSFGKPVIAGDIPALAEVVAHGEDGYLVSQNPAEIAECICELLLDSALAQNMGEAGKRKVEKRYTWKQLAERTSQIYSGLLG